MTVTTIDHGAVERLLTAIVAARVEGDVISDEVQALVLRLFAMVAM